MCANSDKNADNVYNKDFSFGNLNYNIGLIEYNGTQPMLHNNRGYLENTYHMNYERLAAYYTKGKVKTLTKLIEIMKSSPEPDDFLIEQLVETSEAECTPFGTILIELADVIDSEILNAERWDKIIKEYTVRFSETSDSSISLYRWKQILASQFEKYLPTLFQLFGHTVFAEYASEEPHLPQQMPYSVLYHSLYDLTSVMLCDLEVMAHSALNALNNLEYNAREGFANYSPFSVGNEYSVKHSVGHGFDCVTVIDLRSILNLEAMMIYRYGYNFKHCECCEKFFIPTGRNDKYCKHRPYQGEKVLYKSCGAYMNYVKSKSNLNNSENTEVMKAYRSIYNKLTYYIDKETDEKKNQELVKKRDALSKLNTEFKDKKVSKESMLNAYKLISDEIPRNKYPKQRIQKQ